MVRVAVCAGSPVEALSVGLDQVELVGDLERVRRANLVLRARNDALRLVGEDVGVNGRTVLRKLAFGNRDEPKPIIRAVLIAIYRSVGEASGRLLR